MNEIPTAIERAAAVYEREPCARSFREDLEAHLLNGYVHSTPRFFVMARPVDMLADESLILDPWHTFEHPNAWLIWLAAGDLRPALELFPFELPFLGWQKRNILRFWERKTALARLAQMRKT